MLHIVTKSPHQSLSLASCLRVAQPGHSLLLTEDAVIAATAAGTLAGAIGRLKVFALTPDLEARGLAGRQIEGVSGVDYAGFVALVAENPTNQTWL